MTSLIKRLKTLTGPDREVDAEIAKAIGWVKYITWTSPNGRIYADCPNFTNSLDAAMTLVPEGCEIELTNMYGVARSSND